MVREAEQEQRCAAPSPAAASPPRGVNFALFGLSAPGWGQAARRPLMAPRRARAGPQGLCEGAPSRLGPGGVAELRDETSPALPQAAPALPAFWES